MSAHQYAVAGFAVPEGLDQLHALLAQVAEDHPALAPTDLMHFETAVIEIAGNVVEHGADGGASTWTFTLTVTSTQLRGLLADNGAAWDGSVTAALPQDPLAESGRGLALARATLDELEYARVGDANHWLMVRARNDATG